MILSICWISRRAMKHPAPMISSISLRSPQKTCGLFDTGLAGDASGITSFDLNAPAVSINNPFTLGSLDSANFTPSGPVNQGDSFVAAKLDNVQGNFMDNFDMLNPLADLETDQLADDSLDAFMNLDSFLMENSFLDETAEVKPVIEIPEANMTYTTIDSDLGLDSLDLDFFLEPVTSTTASRKRKLPCEEQAPSTSFKTSLFEIPVAENAVTTTSADAQLDHDYTNKRQRMSSSSEKAPKSKVSGSGTSKGKSVAAASPAVSDASCTSTSMDTQILEGITDKQVVRRIKNNVASKRSREQRKKKFADLDAEAEHLIEANENLRQKIVELEKLATDMKAQLVAKMAGKA